LAQSWNSCQGGCKKKNENTIQKKELREKFLGHNKQQTKNQSQGHGKREGSERNASAKNF
jgi:hypothetical protein